MKNSIKIILGLALALVVVSCGKNYTYEKVVVNNSDQEITIKPNYEGYQEETIIPPRESRVVFVCSYPSYKKPNCEDVSNKFELIGGSESANNQIKSSASWNSSEYGRTVRCTYNYQGN
jgi:hypothetical protein